MLFMAAASVCGSESAFKFPPAAESLVSSLPPSAFSFPANQVHLLMLANCSAQFGLANAVKQMPMSNELKEQANLAAAVTSLRKSKILICTQNASFFNLRSLQLNACKNGCRRLINRL